MKQRFDVLVVGGGHSGTEAALAAHRMGVRVALVTHRRDRIGEMSCNPAIGGIGKGHIVREIDALDGAMGRLADAAGIQFRLLNRKKGPAVQGPRAQCDRALYRAAAQGAFAERGDLVIIEDDVVDLRCRSGRVTGVELQRAGGVDAARVILTTGTFLGGVIHLGHESRPAGRIGDASAERLACAIRGLGLATGRLKTGTPPRIDGGSIDWDGVGQQPGDSAPVMLSFLNGAPVVRQVTCGVTYTNARTHEIIRDNLAKSALYGGAISGAGPRYCPSIEDKVVRFTTQNSHQVFLEPEGLTTPVVYPNGISTSLPAEVQLAYVRSIGGLEAAVILQPGYAVEYDYVDPRSLSHGLEVTALPGLYLAGQINGTTGYEEAAGQGLVAGVNAAASCLGRDPLILDRASSYIGVMIDDLVSRGVTEPYRMFTSRSEFRLALRADNADQRLTPVGIDVGCVGATRAGRFGRKMEALARARGAAEAAFVTPTDALRLGLPVNQDGRRRSGLELLRYPDLQPEDLIGVLPGLEGHSEEAWAQVKRDCHYAPYLERQERDVANLRRDEATRLDPNLEYSAMAGLSSELKAKLSAVRPGNLGQANRIEGMTPAALSLLLVHSRKVAGRAG